MLGNSKLCNHISTVANFRFYIHVTTAVLRVMLFRLVTDYNNMLSSTRFEIILLSNNFNLFGNIFTKIHSSDLGIAVPIIYLYFLVSLKIVFFSSNPMSGSWGVYFAVCESA
jgi:hypothetical protein